MALPSSGAISLNNVNVELGLSGTAQISMNDAAVRSLFGKASGAISMSDGYGKSSQFSFTISSNQTNANLATLGTAAGWNGTSKLVATINSGIYISSNSTGTPALTVSGSFPGGVELTNNGTIVGMGGNGGNTVLGIGNTGQSGGTGGTALSVSSAITITNNGTIAGGGGGGGAGGANRDSSPKFGFIEVPGGGGGGGRSGLTNTATSYNGGAAGTLSAAGGGGGRSTSGPSTSGAGGSGGGWGAGGGGGEFFNYNFLPGSGGSGGNAVSGNSNVTWAVTGTRYGGLV